MPAVKSGNNINVSGTGNTLASITADINDVTFIEQVSAGVFRMKNNINRILSVLNGGVLTIGHPNDYSVTERLEFGGSTANDMGSLNVNAGGQLLMYGNTIMDLAAVNAFQNAFSYWNGRVEIRGNSTYKPIVQNARAILLGEQGGFVEVANEIMWFEDMIIGSSIGSNQTLFTVHGRGRARPWIFRNITVDITKGRNIPQRPFMLEYASDNDPLLVFENIDAANCGSGGYKINTVSSPCYHMKNVSVGTGATDWKINWVRGHDIAPTLFGYPGSEQNRPVQFGQRFLLMDNWTINASNSGDMLVRYGAVICMKNCTFHNSSAYWRAQVQYQGVLIMWTGNTYTASERYWVAQNGMILWVKELHLTVLDNAGQPVEGATVLIEQSNGQERFLFETKANGKLKNVFDLELALLTWKRQNGSDRQYQIDYLSEEGGFCYESDFTYSASGIGGNGVDMTPNITIDGSGGWLRGITSAGLTDRHRLQFSLSATEQTLPTDTLQLEWDWHIPTGNALLGKTIQMNTEWLNPSITPSTFLVGTNRYVMTMTGIKNDNPATNYRFVGHIQTTGTYTGCTTYIKNVKAYRATPSPYHRITIMKPGYRTKTLNVVMNQPRTVVANLIPEQAHALVF